MILDGLQLAYKITANSIYGSIGASTSSIRYIDLAASTTAIGRKMLMLASSFTKNYTIPVYLKAYSKNICLPVTTLGIKLSMH